MNAQPPTPTTPTAAPAAADNDIVVRLENVTVRYRLPAERIRTFKEWAIRYLLRQKVAYRDVLALNGVSLEVRAGEVFGLIGPNGAGKSTLLKLVARVLRPTAGRVWVKGHVAPLLAMGAAFHPELTGRENVYLNGTLLGMTHREINNRFQAIVDFAEMWDFIDAPLRTYSSGMTARLAFAVATDRQPDILIVDEVLGVGDTAFQEKSLNRIRAYQEQGATTLFVSHSMNTIKNICQRAAWLDHGQVKFIGPADEAVERYLASLHQA